MARGATAITENNQLTPILGIFQKLMSSKITEAQAFDLLESLFAHFPVAAIQPFVKDIFIILFTRLNGSKTEILVRRFIRFFYFLAGKEEFGPDFVIGTIDSVQSSIFGQLYPGIVLPDTQKLTQPLDRKIAVAGLTKLIGFSDGLAGTYHGAWPNTVMVLLKVLELAPVLAKDDPVDLQAADIDDVSFGASFARLSTCKKRAVDEFPEVVDSRRFVGEKLVEANTKTGGRLDSWINGELGDDAKALLKKYMASTGRV